ncbi:ATP-binding cassette domain-containing protein [Salinibacterium sp. M195]|uniref:ATP-binding cassette domain-containing protein n=1 Tax=Salinibacterium sp. M195 TaxID=2583374 RepID=UPI001C6317F5|nr:ATP-binding cassette domain-containing protein [Salinibacterium sp. M195]QYH36208.1 ATP-binding cassette domain-containing protein [Salinibacterium sp. M195]
MSYIEAVDLKKTYTPKGAAPVHALDGLNLEVPQGTVTALLGPNGAGKTTTVKVLTTLIRPDSGSATINGIDVIASPERIRPMIGVSGQYAAVDENLTGFENLDMVGRLYHLGAKQSRERARELINLFDLAEAQNRPVKGFSGGMRRRIDLAGALVMRPPVLFLDEPTTGLDPRSRLGMWDVITTLVGEGTTVLLTTQYLEEADQLADSISVIDDGKVIAQGTSDELKASIGGQRVEVSLVSLDDATAAHEILTRFGSTAPTVSLDGRGLTVNAEDAPAALQLILTDFASRGIQLYDAGMRRPTLDDVFLKLTGHTASTADAETTATESAAPAQKVQK